MRAPVQWLSAFLEEAEGRSLSAQTAAIIGIKVVAAGTAFAVQIPLARMLGTQEYGVYALVMSWVLIAAVFMRGGMDAAMVRYAAIYAAQGQHEKLRGVLAAGLGWGGGVSVLAMIAAFAVPAVRDWPMMQAGLLLLVPATMGVMLQAALRGIRRVILPEVTEGILRPVLMLGLFWAMTGAWLGRDAYGAAAANVIAGTLMVAVLAVWLARTMPRALWRERADMTARREWWALAWPMMVMAGLQLVLYRTDIIMLGAMMDTQQAGIYAVAMRMAELAGFGVLAVNGLVAPLFAELYAGGHGARLARLLRFTTMLALGTALMAALGLVVLGPWFVGLFGEGFAGAYAPLVVLVAGQVAHAAGAPAAILLTMAGQQRWALAIFTFCAVLNVALNATFITAGGMMGAAAATTTTYVIYSVLMVWAVRKRGVM